MLDKSARRVAAMFGQISPRYDLLNHLLSLQADRYWRWVVTRRVPAGGTEPILDVCSGTGDLALAYLRQTRGRCPVVAVDVCAPMLALAGRKWRSTASGGTLHRVVADAQFLPLKDDTFQAVCVAFGLRNVADTDRGLREMVRVARPGASVAILEFSKPSNRLIRFLYYAYFRYVLPIVGQAVARNAFGAYQYLPDSVMAFPHGQALIDRMRASGLVDIRAWALTFGIATLYVGRKPTSAG